MDIRQLEKQVTNKLSRELPKELSYHNLEHTLHVLNICRDYIKRLQLPLHDAYLLETAALLHDTGYIWYFDDHEEHSIEYAKEFLPTMGYSNNDIEVILNIIRATKIPQQPKTLLEKIIADADLDYLGTDQFYSIAERLYHELMALDRIKNEKEWNALQIRFIQKHHYHTAFAQKYREPVKQKHLMELRQQAES